MNDLAINVVSYKRPKNTTCDLLAKTSLNWKVYVYHFDEYLKEYLTNYKTHVRVITEFNSANLAAKRQLVLDDSIQSNYNYCVMLDDDILEIVLNDTHVDICTAINYLYETINNSKYIAVSAAYHKEKSNILENMNVCNNSIFDLSKYKKSNVKYNYDSKCEDAEFTIDLLLKGYSTARIGNLIIKNVLQGGTTNTGLFYRFDKNRFIVEGEYLRKRYPDLNIFDYDENHLSIKTYLLRGTYEN